jgi:hypothetical protein
MKMILNAPLLTEAFTKMLMPGVRIRETRAWADSMNKPDWIDINVVASHILYAPKSMKQSIFASDFSTSKIVRKFVLNKLTMVQYPNNVHHPA